MSNHIGTPLTKRMPRRKLAASLALTLWLLTASFPAPSPGAEPGEEQGQIAVADDPGTALSSLVFQPLFLATRLVVAVPGAVIGGMIWAVTGGNTEAANRVWDPALMSPWTWPEFTREATSAEPK